jgi:hypothetical protein
MVYDEETGWNIFQPVNGDDDNSEAQYDEDYHEYVSGVALFLKKSTIKQQYLHLTFQLLTCRQRLGDYEIEIIFSLVSSLSLLSASPSRVSTWDFDIWLGLYLLPGTLLPPAVMPLVPLAAKQGGRSYVGFQMSGVVLVWF